MSNIVKIVFLIDVFLGAFFLTMASWLTMTYYLKFVAQCANGALLFCIIVVILLEIPTTKINVPMNFDCRLEEDMLNCIYTNLKLL